MEKGNTTILASVLAIALVAAGIGMGTMAYFSDVETSTGNIFEAGTIDLSEPEVVEFTISDLKPCETGYIRIKLRNDGNNKLEVWKHIYNIVCEENGIVEPEQEWYDANPGVSPKNNIDDWIIYDLWIDANNNGILDENHVGEPENEPEDVDTLMISEGDGRTIADVESYWIYLGQFSPGRTKTIVQSYHMKPETGNWAQSDTMTFDIEFYAQQTATRPPPPGTEFPQEGRDN